MNMVKERMVTLGFNKENLRNSPTPSGQQSQRQPIKATPPKAKRAKLDSGGGSTSNSTKQSGEDKCSKCGGFHKKKDCPNPPQAIIPTLIPANHVPIVMYMGMMLIIVSHFTQNYGKANHKTLMPVRAKVLGRAKKGKV